MYVSTCILILSIALKLHTNLNTVAPPAGQNGQQKQTLVSSYINNITFSTLYHFTNVNSHWAMVTAWV